MHRYFLAFAAILLVSAPAAAENVGAFLEPGASADNASAATVLGILKAELEKKGLSPVAIQGYENIAPPPEAMKQLLPAAGVNRAFTLGANPLGAKLVLSLSERDGPDFGVVFSERMTAASIEEADTVIPRLVASVLARKPAESQQSVTSVTTQEARPMRKKAGDLMFGGEILFGAPMCKGSQFEYGLGFRMSYEMPHARIDVDTFIQLAAGVSTNFVHWSALSVGGVWMMLDGNISPYLGGSVGFALGWIDSGGILTSETKYGAMFSANIGAEFFRLYSTRMFVEARFGFPTFRQYDTYIPIFTTMLGVMFY